MRPIDADALLEQMKELYEKRAEEAYMTGNRVACVTWDDAVVLIKNAPIIDDAISRQAAIDALAKHEKSKGHNYTLFAELVRNEDLDNIVTRHEEIGYEKGFRDGYAQAVTDAEPVRMKDSVPWEFLGRYAEWFCALVSYPGFIREAKRFYEDTYKAELGGNIDDSK